MKFKKNFYKVCLWITSSVSLCDARRISVVPLAIRWVEQNTDRILFSELLPRML